MVRATGKRCLGRHSTNAFGTLYCEGTRPHLRWTTMSIFEKFAQQANNVLIKPRRLPAPWVPSLADRVAGRTVLITGASSGIGRALAEAVAAAGATTLVVARRADELAVLVREIRAR